MHFQHKSFGSMRVATCSISFPLAIVENKFVSTAIGLWCVHIVASFERSTLVDPSSGRPVMDNAYPAICPYPYSAVWEFHEWQKWSLPIGLGFGMKGTPPRFQRNWTASDGLGRWLQCGQEPSWHLQNTTMYLVRTECLHRNLSSDWSFFSASSLVICLRDDSKNLSSSFESENLSWGSWHGTALG